MSTSGNISFLLLCSLGLILFYGIFVCASIAIARSRRVNLHRLKGSAARWSRLARVVLMHGELYLLSAQIAMFLIALLTGFCVVEIARSDQLWHLVSSFSPYLNLPHWLVTSAVVLLIVVPTLIAVQIAKGFAFSRPEKVLAILAPLIIVVGKLCSPFVIGLRWIVTRSLNSLGIEQLVPEALTVSAEDIREIVELSNRAGEIDIEEKEMIDGVVTFSDTIVREVMTPRRDILSVDQQASLDEVSKIFLAEGISRLIVTGENIDDVIGILLAKDLMSFVGKPAEPFNLKNVLRPAYFVPNNKKVGELLSEFRSKALHLAVVLDEHGGVDGLVTLEDLLEEIVGEIFDEYDLPAEQVGARRTKSGDLLVSGGMLLDDLNEQYGFALPIGEYDTVAGYVLHSLGRLPEVGEVIRFDGTAIRVEKVSNNRVTLVRVGTKRADRPNWANAESERNQSHNLSDAGPTPEPKLGIFGGR